MAYSQKEPDAAAIKDDKLQYGHGPLTPEELEEK
jgi:DNA ligase-4